MSPTDLPPQFDQAKADAFAGRLLTALNHGALCLMISVGHRTGLFDVMRESPPSTSEELAARAGLNERYVREWLGAMVTGRRGRGRAGTASFSLPAEHAAFLTRAAAADNMASSRNTSPCWAVWRTTSSSASRPGAACRTRGSPASTR